jgi:DNA-binding MarR family transcriptional regulator
MNDVSANAHRLLQLFEQMRDKRHSSTFLRLNELNLSFTHVRALHLLAANHHTLAMKDLAEQMCLTPPSVTALARRLVQTGLVQRQPHAEDSRVTLLALTGEGRALLHDIYQEQLVQMDRLLQGLTPVEQTLFLNLLERAVQTLRSSMQPD